MLLMDSTLNRKMRAQRFHEAAMAAYNRHGFLSYRHAEQLTGVSYSTVYNIISRGRIPTRGQVIEWAEGLDESINYWLELAGYDIIRQDLVCESKPDYSAFIPALRAEGKLSEKAIQDVERVFNKIAEAESNGDVVP